MKACVLIKTEAGKHRAVTGKVSKIKNVKISFPVLGRTDVVADVEVGDLKKLSELILEIGGINGVVATETLIGLEV